MCQCPCSSSTPWPQEISRRANEMIKRETGEVFRAASLRDSRRECAVVGGEGGQTESSLALQQRAVHRKRKASGELQRPKNGTGTTASNKKKRDTAVRL